MGGRVHDVHPSSLLRAQPCNSKYSSSLSENRSETLLLCERNMPKTELLKSRRVLPILTGHEEGPNGFLHAEETIASEEHSPCVIAILHDRL